MLARSADLTQAQLNESIASNNKLIDQLADKQSHIDQLNEALSELQQRSMISENEQKALQTLRENYVLAQRQQIKSAKEAAYLTKQLLIAKTQNQSLSRQIEQLQQKSELCDQLQNVQNINDELARTKAK